MTALHAYLDKLNPEQRGAVATHGLHISNREHPTGRFNSHLMQCCFLFLDEAVWPGDKAGEAVLKRVVTEPRSPSRPRMSTLPRQ